MDGEPTVAGQPYWHSIWAVEFGAAGGDKGCRDDDGFGEQPGVGGAGGGRIDGWCRRHSPSLSAGRAEL